MLIIRDWIKLKILNELHAVLYKSLQRFMNSVLVLKLENPNYDINHSQDQLIGIIKELLK